MSKQQLLGQLNQAYMAAGSAQERAQIKAQIDNIQKMGTVTSPGGQAVTDSRLNQDASFTGTAPLATTELDGDVGVSDAGIPEGQFRGVISGKTPSEKLMGANQSLEQGMETFADGMVSRPDQGQRIDPNRFSTGTLTEAEARRIEGSEGGIFDALRKGANAMFGAADVAKEVPIDRSGQKVDMGGKTLPNAFQDRGGFSLADLYNEYAPRIKRSVMGVPGTEMPDPEGMLVTGFSGQDSVDANAYQSGTGDVPGPGPVEQAQARAAREVDTTIDDGDLRSMPFRDFDDGDVRTMPETVADQIAKTEDTTKTLAGTDTTIGGVPVNMKKPVTTEQAADSENAGVQELQNAGVSGDTLTTIGSLTDMFKNEEGAAAKRYREYLQNLPKQAGQRKSDALAMFALQTGIGMLAQPGGQTALQAAGKSANNAMKTYVEEMRDIRGLEEKALKGEVALEELQQKRADANLKIAADIYGRQLVADTSLAAAKINAGKPTDATRGINRFVDAINEKVANGEMRAMSPAQIRLKAQNDYYGLLAEVQASKLAQSSVTDQATIINSIQTNARSLAETQFEAFIGAQKDAYKLTAEERQAKLNELYNQALKKQYEGPLGKILNSYGGGSTTGNPLVDKYLQ
jgi:hypothetical protein